jgi:hypothetical protein
MNQRDSDPVILTHSGLLDGSSETGNKGSPVNDREAEEKNEDLKYDPIPPKKTVTVTVRYHIRGRGRPLPYPLGAGDGR